MPDRKPGETISEFAIRTAFELGHFWNPTENPGGRNISHADLELLKPEDDVVVKAMISMAKADMTRYTKIVLEKHGRQPYFDGIIGPAIEAMVTDNTGRCPIPDFAPPPGVVFAFDDPDLQEVVLRMQRDAARPVSEAFGSGNWRGCHEVGNFHSASIGVNKAGLPSFLAPVFTQVLKNVQRAYAGVGLLFRFIGTDGVDLITGKPFSGTINSDMSFVSNSQGWIGLAIIGQGEQCGGRIWCKFLSTYQPSSVEREWTTLIKHELLHNCGSGHTNGGVGNPSIVPGLPTEWVPGDPSTPWLKSQFGGVPAPIPGDGPIPPIPPNPPSTLEQRMLALEIKNVINEVTLQYVVNKVKNLP